jgi:hypothetical protein
MTPIAKLGLLSLSAALYGCVTAPPVVQETPPLPDSLFVSCLPVEPVIASNGDLAEAYLVYRACAEEQSARLAALRVLNEKP